MFGSELVFLAKVMGVAALFLVVFCKKQGEEWSYQITP
jgi:hypothetical protein